MTWLVAFFTAIGNVLTDLINQYLLRRKREAENEVNANELTNAKTTDDAKKALDSVVRDIEK